MASLVKDAKSYYSLFYEGERWSERKALETLGCMSDCERRIEIVRRIYEIILDSEKRNKYIQKYVATGLSIQGVGEVLRENPANIKSSVHYFNQTVGKALEIDGENLIRVCVLHDNISNSEWRDIENIINEFAFSMGNKVFEKNKIISNKNIMINIPRKVEINRELSDKEFEDFMKIIEPYFISVRKKNQKRIYENNKAAGYFNFILSPGAILTEKDLERRERIMKLLDKETKKMMEEPVERCGLPNSICSIHNKEEIEIVNNDTDTDDETIDLGITENGTYRTTFVKF